MYVGMCVNMGAPIFYVMTLCSMCVCYDFVSLSSNCFSNCQLTIQDKVADTPIVAAPPDCVLRWIAFMFDVTFAVVIFFCILPSWATPHGVCYLSHIHPRLNA